MRNKGFTLIELLAVIVILAIIALIATPIILGIINDARESAKTRSAELVATGVEYAITTYMYRNNGSAPDDASDLEEFFSVDHYTLDDGEIKDEKGNTFCTLTISGDATVTCNNVRDFTSKTIKLGTL